MRYNVGMKKDSAALVQELADRLLKQRHKVCTAESCTGGLIAKTFTDLAGSSDWLDRGFVTYSNEAKSEMLDVPVSLIEDYGAVSEAVVRAMAEGAIHQGGADVAVSVSGIAGPDGGTDDKPVGTVWFAWALLDDNGLRSHSSVHLFSGDREAIRRQSVIVALEGLLDL